MCERFKSQYLYRSMSSVKRNDCKRGPHFPQKCYATFFFFYRRLLIHWNASLPYSTNVIISSLLYMIIDTTNKRMKNRPFYAYIVCVMILFTTTTVLSTAFTRLFATLCVSNFLLMIYRLVTQEKNYISCMLSF